MAGIDLALVMIEEDFSRNLALDVAKHLIINLRKEGWQSQFSPLLECEIVLERQIDALMRSVDPFFTTKVQGTGMDFHQPEDRRITGGRLSATGNSGLARHFISICPPPPASIARNA